MCLASVAVWVDLFDSRMSFRASSPYIVGQVRGSGERWYGIGDSSLPGREAEQMSQPEVPEIEFSKQSIVHQTRQTRGSFSLSVRTFVDLCTLYNIN